MIGRADGGDRVRRVLRQGLSPVVYDHGRGRRRALNEFISQLSPPRRLGPDASWRVHQRSRRAIGESHERYNDWWIHSFCKDDTQPRGCPEVQGHPTMSMVSRPAFLRHSAGPTSRTARAARR